MKYLNLSEGFTPFKSPENDLIKFKSFFFSGGEPHIKINWGEYQWEVMITIRINSMSDLGLLMMAKDALDGMWPGTKKHLYVPYFPGARQDRRMVKGEPLSVKVYADTINRMAFESVTIFDPHSDVTPALINNCRVIDNTEFVAESIVDIYGDSAVIKKCEPYIISPDAGSIKKVTKLVGKLSKSDPMKIVKCGKDRNVVTGELSGFTVYTHDLGGKDCIIVDDICDGGGTFIGLAKELKKKGAGDLYLIVSHGIFSKDIGALSRAFKHIYTTDSIRNKGYNWQYLEGRTADEILSVIELNQY